jgi:hypothetical protein
MDTNELGNITHSLDHVFNHEYSYVYIIKIIENPQLHHLITEPYSKMKTVQEYISSTNSRPRKIQLL